MTLPTAHASDWAGTCPSTAVLSIGGKRIGVVRCQRPIGHGAPELGREQQGPHTYALDVSWNDDLAPDWPEAYDVDEQVDIEVPAEAPLEHGVDEQYLDAVARNGMHPTSCPVPAQTLDGEQPCVGVLGHSGTHWAR